MSPGRIWPVSVAALLLLCALLISQALGGIPALSVGKEAYMLGEEVSISVAVPLGQVEVYLVHDGRAYLYSGPQGDIISFRPSAPGNYTVLLRDASSGALSSESFVVLAQASAGEPLAGEGQEPAQQQDAASPAFPDSLPQPEGMLSRGSYEAGETVRILCSGAEEVRITRGDELFVGTCTDETSLSFIPREPGLYVVELVSGGMLSSAEFTVAAGAPLPREARRGSASSPVSPSASVSARQESGPALSREDGALVSSLRARQEGVVANLAVRDALGSDVAAALYVGEEPLLTRIPLVGRLAADRRDVLIEPRGHAVKRLVFSGLDLSAPVSLGLSSSEPMVEHGRQFIRAYALDPSQLDFESATFTATASGRSLYKCREWNFSENTCMGSWTRVRSLTPGEDYTVELTPDDPGFAETGITTVNSLKPIYRPGETAELLIGVVDTEGHLISDATVDLLVTDPDGATTPYSTTLGTVVNASPGVYRAFHPVAIEGRHNLTVSALAPAVNHSMSASFESRSFFEFDILRDSPIVIDPMAANVSTNFTLVSFVDAPDITLTESLPQNFTVLDAGGAEVSSAEGRTLLTWSGLGNGTRVGYVADIPVIMPELYELGPAVVGYSLAGDAARRSFDEARVWYLTADAITLTDTSVTTNRSVVPEGQRTWVSATFLCTGTGNLDFLFWLKDDGTDVTTTSAGRDFTCPNAANVTCNAGGSLSCTVNANCSISVDNCGSGDTPNATWTLIASANAEALPSRNNMTLGASSGTMNDSTEINISDDTPPRWSGLMMSPSPAYQSNAVKFNASWLDDYDLGWYIFAINEGSWQNQTPAAFSGATAAESNYTYQVTSEAGTFVYWRFFANDSINNENRTDTMNFTVGGVVWNQTSLTLPQAQVGQSWPESTVRLAVHHQNTGINVTCVAGDCATLFSNFTNGDQFNNTNVSVRFNCSTASEGTFQANFSAVSTQDSAPSNISVSCTIVLSDLPHPTAWAMNTSPAYQSDAVSFNATWADDIGLSHYLFAVNASGWLNSTALAFDPADNESNYTYLITAEPGQTVEWAFFANDSDNQFNRTPILNFTVGGIVWNQSALDLGSAEQLTPPLTGTVSLVAYHPNTNIQVACLVGDCGTITHNFTNGTSLSNVSSSVLFTCNTSATGSFYANFSVVSSRDTYPSNISVNCTITASTDTSPPNVTIHRPPSNSRQYNYTDSTNNSAWEGGNASLPPAGIQYGTEAEAADYTAVSTSDDSRWISTVSSSGLHPYQSYRFAVPTDTQDVVSITLTHEGYALRQLADNADSSTLYVWNYTSGSYSQIAVKASSSSDITSTVTFSVDFSSIIGSGDYLYILFEGNTSTTAGQPRGRVLTDYIALDVVARTVISGQYPVNATVTDSSVVSWVSYRLINDTSTATLGSWTGMTQTVGSDVWYNTTDTAAFADGLYTFLVNASDAVGNLNGTVSVRVRILNAYPTVTLNNPANNTNWTQANITLNWTPTISAGGDLLCDVYVNGTKNNTAQITVANGTFGTWNLTSLRDGSYRWQVNCTQGSLTNSSETWIFKIDANRPAVTPTYPPDGFWNISDNLTVLYNVSDYSALANCSLVLNGITNLTNTTSQLVNPGQNFFNLTGLGQKAYNWSINCSDEYSQSNTSVSRLFTIDWTAPGITLLGPPSGSGLNSTTVTFNLTATDNLAAAMTCNLTIDDVVRSAGFTATNSSVTNVTVNSILDGVHWWNVTCRDYAGNTNTSETWNFTIFGGPAVALLSPENYTANASTTITFVYNASDYDGVQNCTLAINNITNSTTYFPNITNFGLSNFTVSGFPEGRYDWNINCTDNVSREGASDTYTLFIDLTEPGITLINPQNAVTFTTDDIQFNYTAYENTPLNMTCLLALDGTVEDTRSVANNSLVTIDLNDIGDGNHTWYVNCTDSVGRANTSATWWFVADGPPNVYLDSPANDTGDPDGNVTFFYNITDLVGVDSCSLIIDGVVNQTSYNNRTVNYTGAATSGTVTASERDKWLAQDGSYGQFTVSSEESGTVENFTTGSGTIGTVEVCWRYYTSGSWTDDSVNLQWFVDGSNATSAFNVTMVIGNSSSPVTNCSDITAALPGLNWANVSALNLRATGVKSGGADGWDFLGDVFYVRVKSDDANLTNNARNNFTASGMGEAVRNWTVNCTDTSGNRGGASPAWVLYVDFTRPGITLTFPADGSTISDDPMNYTFTATDNLAPTFFCNLTRDGALNISFINATSGQAIVLNVTRPDDGSHDWNVTCWDKATNTNTSATFTFTASSVPYVELLAPPSGSAETDDGSVNFTFYLSAVNNISNCTIWFNGVANSTKYAANLTNDDTNNFTLSGLGESYLYWNVTCSDQMNLTGNSSTWLLIVDFSPPSINLTYPGDGAIITNTTIPFNFTPYDTLDPALNCTLFINGIANQSFINATEGQPALVNVTDFEAGQYAWNVTCQDDALQTNYSATRTFTVAQAPIVTLVYPANGSGETDGNITFLFNASSQGATNLTRCDILLDDIINGTKNQSQLANGGQNNFTVAGIPEGNHTWTANCTDSNNVSTIATPWIFYVDSTFPWVALNSPAPNESISQEGVTFNWTAYDLITHTLVCNVSIYNNTLLNRTLENILSPNSTPVTSTANFTGEGWYQWNVTCWDAVGNRNVSETRQFYINFSPSVTLVSPPDNSFTNNSFVNFTYLPEDNTGFSVCYLHINRTLYDSTASVTEGEVNGFYEPGFGEGNITWMVNCTDDDGNRVEAPDWRLTFDFTKPSIRLSWPEQNMTLNTSTVANFTFNVSDNLVPTLNCTVRLDNSDVINLTALNDTPTITTSVFGLNDSIHWWNVTCTDNATNWNTSETWNFTIAEPPEVSLNYPPNGTRSRQQDWNFSYIPYDNSDLIGNCSLIVNGVINQTNLTVDEGGMNNFSVLGFPNGQYNWTVNCTDPSGNWGYNETRALIIDLEGPGITLNYPPEASFVSTENITFNFTPTDAFGINITCNLTILGVVNMTLINTTSGNDTLVRVDNFASGDYNWSVTCWDDLNNTNTSGTSNFTVNAPDLNISTGGITFNDTNPDYDSTIVIFANVSNDGAIPASAIQVEFWDGNPDAGGTQINGNQTIALLANGTSAVVNVSWLITLGYHQIYVLVDPDNNITETSEDNNNASRVITTLYANITYPPNNTLSGNATVQVNFTAADFLNSTLNWSIFVDGALESQNGTIFDENWTAVNLTFPGGRSCVNVQVADPYGRWKNSSTWCIRIDLLAPNISFVTLNGSWFSDGTPMFFFNITDDFDALINFSMFVNGTIDFNGTAPNSTITNATISERGNGTWLLMIQAWDDVNNTANSSLLWFYIDTVAPVPVILTANGTWFGTGSPVIAFNISDNLAWDINYTLYVNGTNNTRGTMTNSVNTTAALSGLTNGTWTITLEGTDMAANSANGTPLTIYVDTVAPVATITSPLNDTYINDSTPEINFTLTDNLDSPINFTIFVDGTANGQTGEAANGSSTLLNLSSLAEGTHTVQVQATDEAANSANSTPPLVIHIDLTPPTVSIVTVNGTWFGTATPLILFNASDNVSLLLNYSFYVNGSADSNGTAVRNNISEAALQEHANGTWTVYVAVEDRVGFTANSSPIIIYIDTVRPSILLNSPENGANFSTSTVTFNWTPSDNLDWNLSCNLTVDSIVNSSLSGLLSGVPTNLTLSGIGSGVHWWNVTCWDHALNTNTSETRWFNITLPDLEVNAGNISLNISSVRENESVTIFATVYNLDRGTATGIQVEFWDGIPGLGSQINGNLTIASLAYGENSTVNVSYAFPIGTTAVYVIVDRPNTIIESSESNNNASLNVTVSAYHLVLGNATGELRSFDLEDISLYAWQKENVTGSNIFVVDTDSSLAWTALRAIGRNLSENESFDDFAEIDTALGMTALNDSVNRTWTLANAPLDTVNLTIYGSVVYWVPVINSTNTSDFRTGILWDTSDANPGQFNASQDLVFITVVQSQLTGLYGVYDYELSIPARLRQYIVPNNDNSVSFYTELK